MGKLNWGKRACAAFVLCAATAIALPAQTLTTLHSFDSGDGAEPYAGLIKATDGNLYGTTAYGGAYGNFGTVFKITPNGTLTTLYSFCRQSGCTDGEFPFAPLVQAADGNFYGTTYQGGPSDDGTVFKISRSGTLTTLYGFKGTDGANPLFAGLIQATDGNLYGTTFYGGTAGLGTVFKITPAGMLTTLHSFEGADGESPYAGLVQASDGNLYGTTGGGAHGTFGTVFKITLSGTLTTLHVVCSQSDCQDGATPDAGALIQATDGNLYGTNYSAGASGWGTVFKITPSGTLTTLHGFDLTDGGNPTGGLVQATDGNLYGTTYTGGVNGDGTIYKITPSGTLATLHSFDGTDGDSPWATLLQDTNGNFYGTTQLGGARGNNGTVFSLSVGLRPFVETQPTSATAGATVKILGANLTGATSVTFNGTAAAFTVVSPSLITATVPVGAASGKVQVVTPSLTLSSNVPFRVRP